jgi:riboflavin kinase
VFPFQFGLYVVVANLEEDVVNTIPIELNNGVYYGYASLKKRVYPMVMSIGVNPYFKNPKRSAEVHLLHSFEEDFYEEILKVAIIGYIRPQLDFSTKEELILAIRCDIEEAKSKLSGETRYHNDAYLT